MVYQKLHVVLNTLHEPFPLVRSLRERQRPNGLGIYLYPLFPCPAKCIRIVFDNNVQKSLVVVDQPAAICRARRDQRP
jgi:hypothetical protein